MRLSLICWRMASLCCWGMFVLLKPWNSLLFLGSVIGVLESLYYVLETFSFVNDAPTVVMIIEQMRIFLVFVLSVIFKMDKFTLKK